MKVQRRNGLKAVWIGLFVLGIAGYAFGESDRDDDHGSEEAALTSLGREDEHGADGDHESHDDHGSEETAGTSSGHEDDHGDHDDNGSGDDHGSEEAVQMSSSQATAFGIDVGVAAPLPGEVELPAEVRFDANKLAKVVPRVSGIVQSLVVTEGDHVDAGQVLAVLDSRDLAVLKADFLEATASEKLAAVTFAREQRLRNDGVTSEAEYLEAQATLAAARAVRVSAETKLHAVGVPHSALTGFADVPDGALGRYRMTSPIAGTVIERRVSLGEALPAGESGGGTAFVVANADSVWVDIGIYATDLALVRAGAAATLHDDTGQIVAEGHIAFVTPQLAESSRTATARMILDNTNDALRPGQFLTARIGRESGGDRIRVPSGAVYEIEGRPAVFVPVEGGFAPRGVAVGAQSAGFVEILSGLESGERYVAQGAFTLKAELEKSAFGDGHGH